MGEDSKTGVCVGQTNVGETRVGGLEVELAVRRDVSGGERLTVQVVSKRQRDSGRTIVGVIARVGGARHDSSRTARYRVVRAVAARGRSRCERECGRAGGGVGAGYRAAW